MSYDTTENKELLEWLINLRKNDKVDVFDEYYNKWRIGTIKKTNCNPYSNMRSVWHLKSNYNNPKQNGLTGFQVYLDGFKYRSDLLLLYPTKPLNLSLLKEKISKLNTYTPIHYYLQYPSANICNKTTKTARCNHCTQLICTACNAKKTQNQYICSQCINQTEYNTLYQIITQSLSSSIKQTNIIQHITDYSIGYLFVCCNTSSSSKTLSKCSNIISFTNAFDFHIHRDSNYQKIHSYKVDKVNLLQTEKYKIHKINKDQMRIFCNKCSNNLLPCNYCHYKVTEKANKYNGGIYYYYDAIPCSIMDTEFNFCLNHLRECCVCKKNGLQNWFHRSYCDNRKNEEFPKYICKICQNHFCNQHGIKEGNVCRDCDFNVQQEILSQVLNDVIGDIVHVNIMDIIISFSVGYIVQCSSKFECDFEQFVLTRTEFEQTIQMTSSILWRRPEPQCIYFYCGKIENFQYFYCCEKCRKLYIKIRKKKRKYRCNRRVHRQYRYRNRWRYGGNIIFDEFELNEDLLQEKPYLVTGKLQPLRTVRMLSSWRCFTSKKIRKQSKPRKAKKKRKRASLMKAKEGKQRNYQSKTQWNNRYIQSKNWTDWQWI